MKHSAGAQRVLLQKGRVAIPAAMPTGIVHPDVHARRAAARRALARILCGLNRTAEQTFQFVRINTGRMPDSVFRQVNRLRLIPRSARL